MAFPDPWRYSAKADSMRSALPLLTVATILLAISTPVAAQSVQQKTEGTMPQYLIEAKYTDAAWAAMAANPQDRSKLLDAVLGKLGGRVDHFWFSVDDFDAFVIVELPDNISAAAVQFAGLAGGGFKSLKTTPLLSVQDAMAAMKKAGELRASSQYGKAHDALTH